ncbi:MAG: PilZ domain-containing protein [bacterium]|nr:PilZ domain-containing protein [bacterium]
MTNQEDHRDFTRVEVHIAAEVASEGRSEIHGTIDDLSMNGVLVVCDEPYPVGAFCDIRLILRGGEETVRVEGRGQVKRVETPGMALEFTEIDADSVDHLRRLVLYNAPDSDRVESELDSSLGIKRTP